jgi:hypothetical protein
MLPTQDVVLPGQLVLTFPPGQNEFAAHSVHNSPSAPTYPGVHAAKYTAPTCMFAPMSTALRLSGVTADPTDVNSSGVTMTVVSTARVCVSSRRLGVCSVTEVISTAVSTTLSALATPDTYAVRTTGVNASRLIKRVAVNVTATGSHGPPGGPT